MKKNKKIIIQFMILTTAAIFMYYGIRRGELQVVLNKAVNICFECIGLG